MSEIQPCECGCSGRMRASDLRSGLRFLGVPIRGTISETTWLGKSYVHWEGRTTQADAWVHHLSIDTTAHIGELSE